MIVKTNSQNRDLVMTVLAVLVLVSGSLFAEESAESWQPPPPMPDKFDWIKLTSDEWLKGELVSLYDKKLTFDSKELDLQTFDWKDVKELRSADTMQVAFEDNTIAVGKLFIDENIIRIMGAEDSERPRAHVLSIAAGAPKEINYWSANASIGANLRRGNTEQIETTARINLTRRTVKNRVNFDYLATFNQTEGVKAADNQRFNTGWNRYYSKKLFWTPLYGEWFRDPFTNIESKWTVGTGLGYGLIDTTKVSWEVTGGLAYQDTNFVDVAEDESTSATTPALVVSTRYENELTGWLDFAVDYRFFIVNEQSGSYTHHLETGFELELTSLLDFDVYAYWDRIQNPQPNSDGTVPEQDDVRLVFALGFDF